MLIEFSVANFLSFKNKVTFSLAASAKKELQEENTFPANEDLRLLRSAVIYGANASGKSNLIKAMNFVRLFIANSSKDSQVGQLIPVNRFRLSSETENMPSSFEIVFMFENVCYRYGFEVDQQIVHKEWFYCILEGKKKEIELFVRERQSFSQLPYFEEGKDLVTKTRNNALFLSVAAQFAGPISAKVFKWLGVFNVIDSLTDQQSQSFTVKSLEDLKFQEEIVKFLKTADLGIDGISLDFRKIPREVLPPDMPDNIKKNLTEKGLPSVFTTHKKYNMGGEVIGVEKFILGDESEGTKKMFALAGPIIDTLKNGRVLVVDEFDARLHPLINRFLVQLFNSPVINNLNAQLIFVSHNIQCLQRSFFRRDQVWFAEKDRYGATDLYSLAEYKIPVRKDASYDKDYIAGKYGAIPLLGDPQELFGEE